MKIVRMKLGDERIELAEYIAPRGRPIPADSRSNDLWFQHFAIVVSDMDKAYQLLRANKVQQTSTNPQRIPDWNKAAAGIRAFYFKDPDGHNLELIYFPSGKGNPKWQQTNGRLFLGIDHTAIAVADTDHSLQFYRDILGMQTVGGTPDGTPDIGASAFLTSRPGEESHEIALFSQPQFRHVAFKVASLAELKRLYRLVLARELPIKFTFNHGASLAFYFDDPDGNMIEIYWPTGKNVRQPCLMPLDLTQTDEAILASIAT